MWTTLLLAAFTIAALAAPFPQESEPEYYSFPGFYFDDMYNETVCSPEQSESIMRTVTNIDNFFAQEPASISLANHPAWERFMGGKYTRTKMQPRTNWFIKEGEPNYRVDLNTAFANIMNSISAVSSFPRNGPKLGGKKGKAWKERITFLCQGPGERIPGKCKRDGFTTAYTNAKDNEGYMGTTITFCEKFFKYKHIDDLVENRPKGSLAWTQLVTREHILYHEYMHADEMGHKKHISDQKASLPSANYDLRVIYGADKCSEYSHLFYNEPGSVNKEVGLNADNYAWLATNVWLRKKWGAENDPLNYLDNVKPTISTAAKHRKRQDTIREGDIPEDDIPEDDTPGDDNLEDDKWPRNCMWMSSPLLLHCNPIDVDYDEYLATLSTLSDECQMLDTTGPTAELNPVHPNCTCTDGEEWLPLWDKTCQGYVGRIVQCQDSSSGDDICSCDSGGGVAPIHVDKPSDASCESLSSGWTV